MLNKINEWSLCSVTEEALPAPFPPSLPRESTLIWHTGLNTHTHNRRSGDDGRKKRSRDDEEEAPGYKQHCVMLMARVRIIRQSGGQLLLQGLYWPPDLLFLPLLVQVGGVRLPPPVIHTLLIALVAGLELQHVSYIRHLTRLWVASLGPIDQLALWHQQGVISDTVEFVRGCVSSSYTDDLHLWVHPSVLLWLKTLGGTVETKLTLLYLQNYIYLFFVVVHVVL